MGCASSKQIRATTPLDVDAYRPSPTSLSVFDINSIEEPWVKQQIQQEPVPASSNVDENSNNNKMLVSYVPPPILEKLRSFEQLSDTTTAAIPTRWWDEISKALHDDLNNKSPAAATAHAQHKAISEAPPKAKEEEENHDRDGKGEKRRPRKSFSFHTLEELDARLHSSSSDSDNSRNKQRQPLRKTESVGSELNNRKCTAESQQQLTLPKPVVSSNSLRSNPFIVKDRLERKKEGKSSAAAVDKFLGDPLSNFPEKCPPNGARSVVLYTTSLRGVRRTFEDCNRTRTILETHRVVFDERDVSLHGEFLKELREVLEGGVVSVPRMFVSGRYIGGAEEVVGLNESGRLGRILSWARVERGVGRSGCDGCGGARFVPCFECAGSCKVVVQREDGPGGSSSSSSSSSSSTDKERCGECNENGLVHCPLCR